MSRTAVPFPSRHVGGMGILIAGILAGTLLGAEIYDWNDFVGHPGGAGCADGTGGEARFSGPCGVALDSAGNVYVADTGNHTLRRVTPAGVVTTLAGRAGRLEAPTARAATPGLSVRAVWRWMVPAISGWRTTSATRSAR